MSTVAVSSFSLVRALGPVRMETRGEDGSLTEIEIPLPQKHTLEEFFQLAKDELGVRAVELCQIQFDRSDDERVTELRAALDASDVELLTVPIDAGDLSSANAEHRADDILRIKRWITIAADLKARYVRVNTGNVAAGNHEGDRAGLIAALVELSEFAAQRGLMLLVENHGGESSDPDYLLSLRADVGEHRLGILLDLGNFEPLISVSHARFLGESPIDTGLDTDPVYDAIARLAPVAALVHAKAFDNASDGTPLLDLERALSTVASSGYSGDISIEWEGVLGDPWERTASVVQAVRHHFPDHA
ncbi:sugar phosphate isomerase/epimerase family protein [Microbacterium saperdae]|uniref:Sugar phosphate isomerase/epimerase n=1 Tax=Microbacterium saperdae TaxID=69368 RepID=A0A543BL58_9MICO|nr:sugar phosphate isomerase/epimerase family protein [Microbacterium saperdae]TQL85551.1 sugar phosphate isomerase/epimerase [Microbacterium saperdae]GGM62861.1 hypothetical protein GCM10010489_37920 [Microbacterium saperdae]